VITMGERQRTTKSVQEHPDQRLELVHVVWLRALDLDPVHEPADTLDLVHLARNDRAVLQHAIGYGRAHRDEHAEEAQASSALRTLEEALALIRPPRVSSFG
jgi:hypothetical protein